MHLLALLIIVRSDAFLHLKLMGHQHSIVCLAARLIGHALCCSIVEGIGSGVRARIWRLPRLLLQLVGSSRSSRCRCGDPSTRPSERNLEPAQHGVELLNIFGRLVSDSCTLSQPIISLHHHLLLLVEVRVATAGRLDVSVPTL